MPRLSQIDHRDALRRAAGGREGKHDVAPMRHAVILGRVGRGVDGREVGRGPLVRRADVGAFHCVHPVACAGPRRHAHSAGKVRLGQRNGGRAVGARIHHHFAARIGDVSSHRREELADDGIRRRTRHGLPAALVARLCAARQVGDRHIANSRRRRARRVVDFGGRHAHAKVGVGEVIAQAIRGVGAVNGGRGRKVVNELALDDRRNIRDTAGKHLGRVGQLRVNVGDAAQAVRAVPLGREVGFKHGVHGLRCRAEFLMDEAI